MCVCVCGGVRVCVWGGVCVYDFVFVCVFLRPHMAFEPPIAVHIITMDTDIPTPNNNPEKLACTADQ